MIKTCPPTSTPEEFEKYQEQMKILGNFLDKNPKAKSLMDELQTSDLSSEEFTSKLMAIMLEHDLSLLEQ
jgi:hypothetical protein